MGGGGWKVERRGSRVDSGVTGGGGWRVEGKRGGWTEGWMNEKVEGGGRRDERVVAGAIR